MRASRDRSLASAAPLPHTGLWHEAGVGAACRFAQRGERRLGIVSADEAGKHDAQPGPIGDYGGWAREHRSRRRARSRDLPREAPGPFDKYRSGNATERPSPTRSAWTPRPQGLEISPALTRARA